MTDKRSIPIDDLDRTPSAPAAEDALDPDPGETAAELALLAAERDTYFDSLLRLQAEFDNYRKRTQRELREADARVRSSVLAEFLPVLDNLERALNAAEHHEEGKVLAGVRSTLNLFADLLRREGVGLVDPLDEPFDPLLHEAMLAQPSDKEEGIVISVLERGYVLGDRVLRPAKVAVSSGCAEGSGD
jgi:molecular chaperone GrpE